MKTFKALKPVGRFEEGDIVGGLTEVQIKQLLADKIIEEVKTSAPIKQNKEAKADVN